MSKAPKPIFLDRDGTINEQVNFLSDFSQMRLLPKAAAAIRAANQIGHPVIVLTNQSGVARGLFSEDFARESAGHLQSLLAAKGARFDGYYFCPYHLDGRPPYNVDSEDRKPAPGMMLRAARDHGLNLDGAFMIGDRASDLETGAHLGVVPLLVRTGYGAETERALPPAFFQRGGKVFDEIGAAISWILESGRPGDG